MKQKATRRASKAAVTLALGATIAGCASASWPPVAMSCDRASKTGVGAGPYGGLRRWSVPAGR
jgi:hypothetical protein